MKDSNLAATNNNTTSRKKCEETLHSHKSCPAKEAQCHHYDIVGHYSKVCHQRLQGSKAKKYTGALYKPSLLAIPKNLKNSATSCTIYGQNFSALIYSCCWDSYINGKAANKLDITIQSCNQDVDLAWTDKPAQLKTMCTIDIELHGNKHQSVVVGVMEHQCSYLILGQDFQQRHGTVVIEYGGPLPTLKVGKCWYRRRRKFSNSVASDRSSCYLTSAFHYLRTFEQAVNQLLLNLVNIVKLNGSL